mmetsp:Transcript_22518/g.85304  ORF Transcript_22518/g.85304 Transcript_22518/m.85304 type:complete len:265 (-) Transcript_22518:225-1019(-)
MPCCIPTPRLAAAPVRGVDWPSTSERPAGGSSAVGAPQRVRLDVPVSRKRRTPAPEGGAVSGPSTYSHTKAWRSTPEEQLAPHRLVTGPYDSPSHSLAAAAAAVRAVAPGPAAQASPAAVTLEPLAASIAGGSTRTHSDPAGGSRSAGWPGAAEGAPTEAAAAAGSLLPSPDAHDVASRASRALALDAAEAAAAAMAADVSGVATTTWASSSAHCGRLWFRSVRFSAASACESAAAWPALNDGRRANAMRAHPLLSATSTSAST